MRDRVLGIVVVLSLVGMAVSASAAFEPLFRLAGLDGSVSIKRPADADFEEAEEGKAYPYGTKIKTGSRSSTTVVFSEGNVCRLLANAGATVEQGKGKKKKQKTVALGAGEIEVDLPEGYDKAGDSVSIKTPTAICKALGGKFNVVSKMERDLRMVVVRCIEGSMKITGEHYDIPTLEKDDWVSLLSPRDRSFLRLKNMKGDYDVSILDENLEEKQVPTKSGTVLKIWQRKVPETGQIVVTTLIVVDGKVQETITVTHAKPKEGWEGEIPDEDVKEPKPETTLGPASVITTPPTTTTTTTTQPPTPTPVGHK